MLTITSGAPPDGTVGVDYGPTISQPFSLLLESDSWMARGLYPMSFVRRIVFIASAVQRIFHHALPGIEAGLPGIHVHSSWRSTAE